MVKDIACIEAKQFIDAGNVALADIRDGVSYEQSHIPGAININDENIESFIQNTDKNVTIVCYCYHGISSRHAAKYFLECGFKKVYSLTGGFESWKSYKGQGDATNNNQ